MKNILIPLVFTAVILTLGHTALAQPANRNYIKEQITFYGVCRNVAITKTNGDLMLYGNNGWAANGCPSGLTEALNELQDNGEYIDDVQLTEDGKWLILYGDNGFKWSEIPYSLEERLREWADEQEVIMSVSFNDDGDWIAISENYVSASNANLQDWIMESQDELGSVWTACVTDDAIVVVYDCGYKTYGDIPETLSDALSDTEIDVYRLKIAGQSWFFSDGKSDYEYNM